jgi:antitoxin HigA-1
MTKFNPITPGELLLEEFLLPMGLSQYRLAKEMLKRIKPWSGTAA